MKPRFANQKNAALTMLEVLLILSVLGILLIIFLPALSYPHVVKELNCGDNLKQIGLSYRIWSGDNNDKYPIEVSVANGGTMELLNGRNAWINFAVMRNALSTPKILLCPQDAEHQPPATNFSAQLAGHVSYFVGMAGSEGNPQSLLSGDDNFEIGGVPVKPSMIELSSNTPIAWTPARHGLAGNILFGDGSVQSFSNSGLTNLLFQTGLATNRLAIP